MDAKQYLLQVLGLDKLEDAQDKEQVYDIFKSFKEAKAVLDEFEKKTLKPKLFTFAEKFGLQTENGGNQVKLTDGTGWERQARNSVSVNQDLAVGLMEDKNLFELVDIEKTIPEENMETAIRLLEGIDRHDLIKINKTVSYESLEQAFLNEKITDDELGSIISRKTTYALVEIKAKKAKKK